MGEDDNGQLKADV